MQVEVALTNNLTEVSQVKQLFIAVPEHVLQV
jgi:hypothetical protein